MNTRIEDNLVLGLTRIFSAYGWNGQGAPASWQDKLATIRTGLYQGDAIGYYTHLKLLIQARNKDENWGIFSPEYVIGIATLLDNYAKNNGLYQIQTPAKKPKPNHKPSSVNIFEHSPILKRLKEFDKTVISYTLIEEYGYDRVLSDLRVYYPRATLFVDYEAHLPDQIRDWEYDNGKTKMTIYFPIMPLAIISIKGGDR